MSKDIIHNVPYGAPVFEHYNLSVIEKRPEEFEKLIDIYINKLKNRNIDADTAKEYLNALVETYITSLLSKLENKHQSTINYIENLFTRRKTDKGEFQREIEILEIQIAETEKDRNLLKDLYDKYNVLYNGNLNMKPKK